MHNTRPSGRDVKTAMKVTKGVFFISDFDLRAETAPVLRVAFDAFFPDYRQLSWPNRWKDPLRLDLRWPWTRLRHFKQKFKGRKRYNFWMISISKLTWKSTSYDVCRQRGTPTISHKEQTQRIEGQYPTSALNFITRKVSTKRGLVS